ncbi:MAG TPA: hypothetical protein VLT33_01760, partial [Labilithrix sp.]|nr:hypothetical protein [Labilithrix sp.]
LFGMRFALLLAAAACAVAASRGVAYADEGPAPLALLPAEPDPRGPEPPVMVFMPPPPEAAPPPPEPPPPPPRSKLLDGGGELSLGTLFVRPSLGSAIFDGSGTPLGGTQRESFRHRGRELGLDAPLMWGGELSLHYMRRYFAVGLMGFVAGNPGGADVPRDPGYSPAADQVNPGAIVGYGAGIDLAAALPMGPVAFRAGGVLGLQGFSVPMTGFEKKTCRSKRGTYPCDEDATTGAMLFFEPRVRMEISPGKSGFVFGGYVGMGVVGGGSPTMGLFVGLQTPHEMLEP